MSTLLIKADVPRDDEWRAAFAKLIPSLQLRFWPAVGRRDDIDYSLTWKLPFGELAQLPNLKVIFSIGAGVDHLVSDPTIPRHLPLVRMADEGLRYGMAEYVTLGALLHHRTMLDYRLQQQRKVWDDLPGCLARDRTVGLLGLGELGQISATMLRAVGFQVIGWSRTAKQLEGVRCFHGPAGLDAFLPQVDVLVSLLPLTPETENLINASLLAKLPRGAAFVSAGRGRQVVEEDLLAVLDSGHLSGATLDVFRTEPLPKSSPLWSHPRVTLTPHCAAQTLPATSAKAVADNILRFERGEAPHPLYDWQRGY